MNDLNLRVSGGVGEKVKKPVAPITMANWNTEKPGATNKFIKEFLESKSADEQLKFLKRYLNKNNEFLDEVIVEFLVSLFWGADGKHPIKGFLKKHITDSRTLEEPFTQRLVEVIKDEIKESANMPHGCYFSVMARLDTCIDKFPPGATAVSVLELDVAMYLLHCLESCIATLSNRDGSGDSKVEPLAPTEINKIYDLAHLTLRLLLYIIQKVTDDNRSELRSMFGRIRAVAAELMRGKEVPMDTKSVSGIVALNLHLFENGPDSWVELLEKEPTGEETGTVELCMYSAVATAVPRPALLAATGGRSPALLVLADKVLDIGDRYSSDPSHALAVARTVLAISKALAGAGLPLARPLAARLAGYCWPQLDHHMDSVRHLAAQTMANVVGACVDIEREGDPSPLEGLFSALESLGGTRGAWAARAQLAGRLGRRVLAVRPGLLLDAAAALRHQPQQASATIFLETLLNRYTQESTPETVYEEFVKVILEAAKAETEPAALTAMQNVLAKAVLWDKSVLDYILPDVDQLHTYQGSDLKCILLVLGVVRKPDAAYKCNILRQLDATMYDGDDEIRILALSLVSTWLCCTGSLLSRELDFVLRWLRLNLNAQAPAFRQLMMAHMKKILRRLENSLGFNENSPRSISIIDYNSGFNFFCDLRQLCFDSLVAGANHGRRACALQLLAWQARLGALLDCLRLWTVERAELVYNVLEDTYEANKALALEVLKDCPPEFISKIEGPGDQCLERLVQQASRVKPTECVSASYKLLLLCRRADTVTLGADTEGYPSRGWFCVLARLLREVRAQAARAQDLLAAARDAPMFGLLHCINRVVSCLDAEAIAGHPGWSQLVSDVIAACSLVNSCAEPVVSAASPEGLLPAPHGDACFDDGRPVTAQMVLMCAWRSVKETSLLLGTLVSRLSLEGESSSWTLSAMQVEGAGAALAGLLARARHRGAFEQAYVGLATLLARLWKCSSARLHQLPLQWFADIERDLLLPTPPEGAAEYCATRRGAGLPFMIQALVTTELAAESTVPRGRLLERCVSLCLRAAGAPLAPPCPGAARAPLAPPGPEAARAPLAPPGPEAAARAHLVLRALFRHAEPAPAHAAQAVMLAVRGFDADTFMERNSSTLLFAALAVRIFGVQRGKDARKLCVRNRMTGRIFFLRYPQLYDFMLDQLQSASPESLRPSLLPTLLLLARLYPSALEGTVSNLKLERFLPALAQLAAARDVATRRLAARALQPLLAPHRYIPHIQSSFRTLSDPDIKRNLCHGILCQLSVLLEAGGVPLGAGAWLPAALAATRWLATTPCYVVADEYLTVLQLLLLRFPEPGLLDEELTVTSEHLSRALFARTRPRAASGREAYLANAAHMRLLVLTACNQDVLPTTMQCLAHPDYEVQLSALNYLLTLHGQCDESNGFLDHLSRITDSDTLTQIQNDPNYLDALSAASKSLYAECAQKALKLITLSPNYPDTQLCLVRQKLGTLEHLTYERTVTELLDSARNAQENLRHVYLESVVQLVSQYKRSTETMLPVMRTLYEHCSAAADERSRAAVVTFLELNYAILNSGHLSDRFNEMNSLALALAAILLEDEEPGLRARTAAAVCAAHSAVLHYVPKSVYQHSEAAARGELWRGPPERQVLASFAAEQMRVRMAARPEKLLMLAALEFGAGARRHRYQQLDDEYRVFDQNETHNVYLEEFTWTVECAKKIKKYYERHETVKSAKIDDYVASLANEHKHIIEQLCIEDAMPCLTERRKSANPKMDLFWKILHEYNSNI